MNKSSDKSDNSWKGKVQVAITKPIKKRQAAGRLLRARTLSAKISKRTNQAGLTFDQIEKDVERILDDIKANRSNRS